MNKEYDIYKRTYQFSIDIINFVNILSNQKFTFTILDQLTRSACSIGANLREAKQSRTKKEFISTFGISLKEAEETCYWLSLIKDTNIQNKDKCVILLKECEEIVKILSTIIIKSKKN